MKIARTAAFIALGILASVGLARAQSLTPGCSNPPPGYGVVWTPGQWTGCLESFQPLIPYTTVNKGGDTMLGELKFFPSSTASAGVNFGVGSAPSAPINGDAWMTSSGIYVQVNGATVGPLGIGSQGAQSANTVFAGPASGSAATPTFRALVGADLPLFNSTTAGAVSASGGGTTNFLRADGTWVAPPGTSAANPTATAGPTAINGSATTYMRSDAAPAVQKASNSQFGIVEPDNTSVIAPNGVLISQTSGFINKLRNPTFVSWPNGTSGTIPTSGSGTALITANGWAAEATGAAGTWSRGTDNQGGSYYDLVLTGAASNTDVWVAQRIGGSDGSALAGQIVTVQFWFWQNTGTSVTPHISTCSASAFENFTTCTADLASTGITAAPSGTWTREAYTFNVASGASNGYQLKIDCGALIASQSCKIATPDMRATPGLSVGIDSFPPPPELPSVAIEMPRDAAYYQTSYGNGVAPGTATANGAVTCGQNGSSTYAAFGTVVFSGQMRTPPTVSIWDTAGNVDKGSVTSSGPFTTNQSLGEGAFNISATGFMWAGSVNLGTSTFIQWSAYADFW